MGRSVSNSPSAVAPVAPRTELGRTGIKLFMKNLVPWKLAKFVRLQKWLRQEVLFLRNWETLVLLCHLPLCPFQILCWNSYTGAGVSTCIFVGHKRATALNNRIWFQTSQFRVVSGFLSTAEQGQPTYSYQMETVSTSYLVHSLGAEVMPRS